MKAKTEKIELTEKAAKELSSVCKVLGIDEREGLSVAIDFFWKECKDTLLHFVSGVRTLPAAEGAK